MYKEPKRMWKNFKATYIKSVEWSDENLGVCLFMTLSRYGGIVFDIGNHLKQFKVSEGELMETYKIKIEPCPDVLVDIDLGEPIPTSVTHGRFIPDCPGKDKCKPCQNMGIDLETGEVWKKDKVWLCMFCSRNPSLTDKFTPRDENG